jgi:regulator of CtrA degradation
MDKIGLNSKIGAKLVSTLYVEAMLLADEARSYFEQYGDSDRDGLTPLNRVLFACESLKVTNRLMYVIAWLLNRRAVENGEISELDGLAMQRRLGETLPSDPETLSQLPERAQLLIGQSIELYQRIARLDTSLDQLTHMASPVQSLHIRLANSF